MPRSMFLLALLITTAAACKPRADAAGAAQEAGSPSTSAASPATLLPVPPEPAPPQAAKASEVPSLEAKLAADKTYQSIWSPEHVTDRALLLTALSDVVAYGTMHSDAEAAVKKAKLGDAVTNLQKILWRVGKLPADFTSKFEGHLAATKSAPHLGLWSPEVKVT